MKDKNKLKIKDYIKDEYPDVFQILALPTAN